ncbi:MAG: ATP/GTP-binding protein [Candidatus Lambdaproteobacteria bacterium RIFOXYD2_FULL_50_16]|uniref:Iron-sulfur cluster carrier protein n=1 Tax=Candidatus Lambdaproteobacteria bacterium RIFOXYD2_FULL_50_16 TaxID=1817772 RepID=A0A1F6GBA4_9PROT|nr:MAG: ATP/GTP-binding protein [Candidatus Lambdaproteobacteria bacterium RIFOXYD2_FULL_50_16]
MDPLEQKIRDAFSEIAYGDTGQNILDADVIYSLEVNGTKAETVLVVPKDYESFIGGLTKAVEAALKSIEGIEEVGIRVVDSAEEAEKPVHHAAPPRKTAYLEEYEHVILVASGKGGVGKSTTAVNLALALKSLGRKVSLLDADVYGPSIPAMMGSRGEFSEVIGRRLLPLSRHGVEFMSLGNLVGEDEAVVWRGPMIHQVMEQMLRDTEWPGGDYCIIDLPPGTGDVQITLAQLTEATGALIVCTPQDVALLDARKAVKMFEKVNIPLLGMIENMSSFICPRCGEETPIFSKGGAQAESGEQDIPFLGSIPIELEVRLGGDAGLPVVLSEPKSASAQAFVDIAKALEQQLAEVQ